MGNDQKIRGRVFDRHAAGPSLAALLTLAWCAAAPAAAAAPEPAATTPAPAELAWIDSLDKGHEDARRHNRPMLLYAGAEWCGPCKLLRKEFAKPRLREKLAAGWTLVRLDVDHLDKETERTLSVTVVPTLRIFTPAGGPVAGHQGFIAADELMAWLDKHYPDAAAAPDPDLAAADAPDADALARLLKKLAGPDPAVREAVVRRLVPHRAAAASAVAEAFAAGKLNARLAALELLQEWKAPGVDALDPWEPGTVTRERLKALKDWAATVTTEAAPTTKPTALDAAAKGEAARQLDRLTGAAGDAEARAATERLARLGPALLPDVYARLKDAPDGRARQRLTLLRYRLVTPDALVLRWPGGLERLAGADTETRHAAAAELAEKAGTDEGPLLLELFSDPDPLVREISLRGMRAAGGGDLMAGLARLLEDPQPNVRAAVLKHLAESPSPSAVEHVTKYAAAEKDVDLLVHAVRVLKAAAANSDEPVAGLIALLSHESWRVRAEGAEALQASVDGAHSAKVVAAMVKLLDDPDGFVASRAVLALQQVDDGVAPHVEALAKAAERHPGLAVDIVKAMTGSQYAGRADPVRAAAVAAVAEPLRRMCAHADPAVRAAAVSGLCAVAPDGAGAELKKALADEAPAVRAAAASALLLVLESKRPGGDRTTRTVSYVNGVRVGEPGGGVDPNQWLADFLAGEGRPAWLADLAPDLERAATAPAAGVEERVAAAAALLALGREATALPVLREVVKADPLHSGPAARALPWLPWEQRASLFNELAAAAPGETQINEIVRNMAVLRDPRAAGPLWDLLARPGVTADVAARVVDALRIIYFGDDFYNASSLPQSVRDKATAEPRERAASGNEWQRLVAMALLASAAPAEAAADAGKLYDDPATPEALRHDALHVMLVTRPADEARPLAAAAVTSPKPELRKTALAYLALGPSYLRSLRDRIYLYVTFTTAANTWEVGEHVPPDVLEAMANGPDAEEAAYASYLLSAAGKPGKLEPLLRYWRAHKDDRQWKMLVYRAVAALNDDALVPLAAEVYETYDKTDYDLRNLYWTIRTMQGPEILKLRKRMRDEVGMEKLR